MPQSFDAKLTKAANKAAKRINGMYETMLPVAKVALHWGWIPLICVIGYNTKPYVQSPLNLVFGESQPPPPQQ